MLEKSIDVDGLTLYDNAALVIWQWEWKDDGDSASDSDEESPPIQSDDIDDEDDDDMSFIVGFSPVVTHTITFKVVTHTITFKCIGSTKENTYQEALVSCFPVEEQ